MTGTFFGKIISAEFGVIPDYPYLIGLQLKFQSDSYFVGDGGKYTVNVHKDCKCSSEERMAAMTELVETVNRLLVDAKCKYVSELVGKPVEISIEGNLFKGFRILKEVL